MLHGPRASVALIALLISTFVVAAGACSGESSERLETPRERAIREASVTSGPAAIAADDDYFEPTLVKVHVGAPIVFTNAGRRLHNVIPIDGGGFRINTDELRPGMAATVAISQPGTYPYFCSVHGTATRGMRGTIAVVR